MSHRIRNPGPRSIKKTMITTSGSFIVYCHSKVWHIVIIWNTIKAILIETSNLYFTSNSNNDSLVIIDDLLNECFVVYYQLIKPFLQTTGLHLTSWKGVWMYIFGPETEKNLPGYDLCRRSLWLQRLQKDAVTLSEWSYIYFFNSTISWCPNVKIFYPVQEKFSSLVFTQKMRLSRKRNTIFGNFWYTS